MQIDEEIVENLKRSRELMGEIDEVIIDQNGNVIDGVHRLKAYPGWKTKTIQADRKKAILLRLHRNYRRERNPEEIKTLLNELAIILEQEGVPKEHIAREIVRLSPYSESYTLSFLPKKYKQPKAVKAAKSTYKILYKEEEKEKPTQKMEEKPKEKIYQCPICGALLKISGELLIPA
ncbi:MAG: hypothetical protein QXH20_04240 [Candidatus Bathyarchaeia archaeon]